MPSLGIQAEGVLGIAFEAAWGTYIAPTKFYPIISESLKVDYSPQFRRVIRGVADNVGAVDNFTSVTGEIEMELMEDALSYFLYCSRNTVVKSGAGPDYTHTCTPTHWGDNTDLPATKKGLSISVLRNGIVFGYVGCVVTGISFGVNDGIPSMKFSIVGKDEASQSALTPVYVATSIPFAPGQFSIEVPAASAIFTADTYEFSVEDNGAPAHRLSNLKTPQAITFGERTVQCTMEIDFDSRTEYDAFKALTATSIKVILTKTAVKKVTLSLPVAYREVYEVGGLSSQGDLVRANVTYTAVYDTATSKAYEIIVLNQENIT